MESACGLFPGHIRQQRSKYKGHLDVATHTLSPNTEARKHASKKSECFQHCGGRETPLKPWPLLPSIVH